MKEHDLIGSGPPQVSGAAFRRLFDEVPEPIAITSHPDGRFLYVNGEIQKLTGYARAELLGRTPREVGIWDHLDDLRALERQIRHKGAVLDFQARLRTRRGAVIDTLFSSWKTEVDGRPVLVSLVRDLGARQQAAAAVRRSEERFRRLSAAAPVGIFETDLDGHVLYTNQRWQEISGLASEEILGDGWLKALHPQDRERVSRDWREAAAAGQEHAAEFRVVRPTGEVRWVHSRSSVLRDDEGRPCGHVGTTQDVTERKRAEEDQDRFFRLSHDFLCVAGFDGYFKRLNPAWTSLGYSTEDLLAVPLVEFIHPDDREATLREIGKLAQGYETTSFEARFRRRSGDYKYLLWNAVPIQDDGSIYAVGRDIGPLKAIEGMRDDFVAMMSHDIKSPLAAALGFLSLLREEPEDPSARTEYFDRVEANVHRAVTLATNFLDASRIRANLLEPRLRPVSLNDVARHAARHQESLARVRRVAITLDLDPELPLLDGDEPLLDRVIVNLLSNAIKFSPEGGEVSLRTARADERVEMAVIDGGPGVPEIERANLFNRYAQISAHRQDGTGLGLFIVKSIVAAHGGTVRLDSSRGAGTVFLVRLPLHHQPSRAELHAEPRG